MMVDFLPVILSFQILRCKITLIIVSANNDLEVYKF